MFVVIIRRHILIADACYGISLIQYFLAYSVRYLRCKGQVQKKRRILCLLRQRNLEGKRSMGKIRPDIQLDRLNNSFTSKSILFLPDYSSVRFK